MSKKSYPTIAIIGLGMMGGSLAQLIKSALPQTHIIGVARRKETAQYAINTHIIDTAVSHISDLPQSIDLVFICTPMAQIKSIYHEVAHHLTNQTVITDIGSVKEGLKINLDALPIHHHYLLGHPMAGIEQTGIEVAKPEILSHAHYLLLHSSDPELLVFEQFLKTLSFRPIILPIGGHDPIVAAGSHIPYLMAMITAANAHRENRVHSVGPALASGYRDTTRVAKSDPGWGVDIARYNRSELLSQLTHIQHDILRLIQWLSTQDWPALEQWLNANRSPIPSSIPKKQDKKGQDSVNE